MKRGIALCRGLLLAALLLAAFAMTARETHAALMTETISGEPVTVDTSTGLVWLEASKTLGLSPNSALADFPGFHLATEGQVITLLEDAGMPAADLPNGSTASTAPGNLLATTLGYSLTPWVPFFGPGAASWEYQAYGWFLDSSGTSADEFFIDVRNPPLGADGTYTNAYILRDSPVISSSNNFDFLVLQPKSQVPEPASFAILGVGLASFGAWRATRARRKGPIDAV